MDTQGYQRLEEHIRERQLFLKDHCHDLLSSQSSAVLEIGCGHGDFLNAYAKAHPNEFCVGVDIIGKRIGKCNKKRDRFGSENLVFVKAEANEFLEALPQTMRLNRVFILFPDPWPKQRHHRRRLLQPDFLDLLASVCLPGAMLCFRTDNSDYFKKTQLVVDNHPKWIVRPELVWPFECRTFFQNVTQGYQSLLAECKHM